MKIQNAMRIVACLFGLAFLAACAAEEEIGTCEPGVSELSEMGTVTPAGC